MARFDTFEKSIQSTIKEEIKINTAGIQSQVQSMNTKFKMVDNKISAHKMEIDNRKVANLDNLHEIIETAVKKQVSEQVAHLEQVSEEVAHLGKDIQNSKEELKKSKEEITKLKEENTPTTQAASKEKVEIMRQDFLREKRFNHKTNLILMGLEEGEEGEDEKSKVATSLQKRLSIPMPKIDKVFRLGATIGRNPRPVLK